MYSGLKYLIYPTDDDPKVDNSRMSGGFPHSDIHGSKPIPGSPWLNAGYHVLHRLLLPRHPPNALFALDLIQKEQGHRTWRGPSSRLRPLGRAAYQKQYLPASPAGSHGDTCWLVYLTWNNIASQAGLATHRQQPLTRGHQRY